LFRTTDGKLGKRYSNINPWASEILREIDLATSGIDD
jgi:hypothetical protein